MSRIGIDPHIAELSIGHLEKKTIRRVYDGHDYGDEMVAARDCVGQHIRALRHGAR